MQYHFSKSVWFWNQKNLFLYFFFSLSFLWILLSYFLMFYNFYGRYTQEGSVYLTDLNSSLSKYSVSSARTAAEHMHFFLISGCLVLRFLFHLFLLLLLFSIISSLLSRIPSILWQTNFFIHLLNDSERFHRMLILSCAFFLSINMTETLFPLWMLFNVLKRRLSSNVW